MHKAYFDASYEWNSKTATAAFIVYDNKGKVVQKAVFNDKLAVDSNHAEWIALDLLLNSLQALSIEEVEVYGDSRNVIDTLSGQSKRSSYEVVFKSVLTCVERFNQITFNWITRNENKVADKLSKGKPNVICMVGAKKRRRRKNKHKKIESNKVDTYVVQPHKFDFNFKYKEKKRRVVVR
ncbi:hypothetical protein A616_16465 [Brevibacillus brevis X23]|nr:hypothetical protein A616_16465 [Brevibacillus brevis X23]